MKCSRPDSKPIVGFLSSRVKLPDKDYWHKLKRLMCWVKDTVDEVRIIGSDDLLKMIVMIDSAHAVHTNMRGQTGGVISFGTGIVDQKSRKQNMDMRSSMETEDVLGTSKYLPKAIYFELFLNAQGYKVETILAKDNESEIRLLRNGKDSCTSNSPKHVVIKYFWSTDRIKSGNMSVEYCSMDNMLANFMSKPVQGKLFTRFRKNVIMGWEHISTLFKPHSPSKEHDGDNDILHPE